MENKDSITELIIKKLQTYTADKILSLEKNKILTSFYEELDDSEITINSHVKAVLKNLYKRYNGEYNFGDIKNWVEDGIYHLKVFSFGWHKIEINFTSSNCDEYKLVKLSISGKYINKTYENIGVFNEEKMFDICEIVINKNTEKLVKLLNLET